MPKHTGKLSRIMGQSAAEISGLSGSEARGQYDYLRKVIREREKTFAKAGKQGRFDRQYGIMGPPSLRGLSDSQVKKQLGRMVKQLSGPESTMTGVRRALQLANEHRKQGLERIMGREDAPLTAEEGREFGRFLGDMQDRYGDNWKHVSDDFVEMLDTPSIAKAVVKDRHSVAGLAWAADQLNLKTSQFMRNFDYWQAHEEQLKNATPIQSKSGRQLTPSDYIKKLRLPKIKDWRALQDGD